jgi:hypothetical protein
MMESVMLYVGADNETGVIDLERLGKVLASRHEGFTMWPAEGSWQGTPEPCAVILVSDEHDQIMGTCDQIKTELRQEAVGWQHVPAMQYA